MTNHKKSVLFLAVTLVGLLPVACGDSVNITVPTGVAPAPTLDSPSSSSGDPQKISQITDEDSGAEIPLKDGSADIKDATESTETSVADANITCPNVGNECTDGQLQCSATKGFVQECICGTWKTDSTAQCYKHCSLPRGHFTTSVPRPGKFIINVSNGVTKTFTRKLTTPMSWEEAKGVNGENYCYRTYGQEWTVASTHLRNINDIGFMGICNPNIDQLAFLNFPLDVKVWYVTGSLNQTPQIWDFTSSAVSNTDNTNKYSVLCVKVQ